VLPLIFILLAIVTAGAFAYGTHPSWAQYTDGLQIILWSRRAEWLLFALAVVFCVALLGLVISGKRRAVWLLGLAPVLGLFFYKFSSDPVNAFSVLDNPPLVSAAEAGKVVGDGDWVVGVRLGDETFAYPYASLYVAPVVVQQDHDKRFVLFWSAFANRARAFTVDRDLKARDMELVSFPANAPLVYNKRWGQFVNALTGQTPDGKKPSGLRGEIATTKTTWKDWRSANPSTKVMSVPAPFAGLPTQAVLPYYPMPKQDLPVPATSRITLIDGEKPVALLSDAVPERPLNVDGGSTPVMVYKDPATGAVRAFDRRLEEDLRPKFEAYADPKRPGVAMVDTDTLSGWTLQGQAVDGDPKIKGKKLKPVDVEEGLYYGVMKYWYPDLTLLERRRGDAEPEAYVPPAPEVVKKKQPSSVRRRRTTRGQ
jgi:hypothetical protein